MKDNKPPLVLLHGWAAGSGCFHANVSEMAPDRSIMMVDLPGFAESDRPQFSDEPEDQDRFDFKVINTLRLRKMFKVDPYVSGLKLSLKFLMKN